MSNKYRVSGLKVSKSYVLLLPNSPSECNKLFIRGSDNPRDFLGPVRSAARVSINQQSQTINSTSLHRCGRHSKSVLRASVCLSRRRLPPVRVTSLELLLSPRQLCRSACRRETLLGSGISENHSEPSLDCTVGGQSVPIQ
ncbi:hypothetical protein TNCV_82421 [Trichonephila clavipes]|nr:hypothetical protein TNCV_82421 [Trichonephila clavipes]